MRHQPLPVALSMDLAPALHWSRSASMWLILAVTIAWSSGESWLYLATMVAVLGTGAQAVRRIEIALKAKPEG